MAPPEAVPTSSTVEGHLYRWNALPFDCPYSFHTWQAYINDLLNKRLPFAASWKTTFVVSACNAENAAANFKTLVTAAADNELTLSVPGPGEWARDVDSLDLSTLWEGVSPALLKD